MRWVNSDGGPLICVEPHIAASWQGIVGCSVGRMTGTDYDRACSVTSYLGTIPCGTGTVLVLGDEPAQSAFVRRASGELLIARWTYASLTSDVDAILSILPTQTSEISKRVSYRCDHGELALLDSAAPGSCFVSADIGGFIPPRRYEITTEKLEQTGVYSFVLHRFLKA